MDEIVRAGDGAIHVRFGGQVQDICDGVLADDAHDGGFVAQIHMLKEVFRMARDILNIGRMAGIGQAMQIDKPSDFGPINDCRMTFEPMKPAPPVTSRFIGGELEFAPGESSDGHKRRNQRWGKIW